MFCVPQRADATAAVAALVTVGGAVVIAAIFAALGIVTNSQNQSSNVDMVSRCLADGKTAGVFDSAGEIIIRKLSGVSMIWVNVITWVLAWLRSNTSYNDGVISDYLTGNNLIAAYPQIPYCTYDQAYAFASVYGFQSVMSAHRQYWRGIYNSTQYYNGAYCDGSKFVIFQSDLSSSGFQKVYYSSSRGGYVFRAGSDQIKVYSMSGVSLNHESGNLSSYVFPVQNGHFAGCVSTVELNNTVSASSTLSATYNTWSARAETLPTSDAEDSATAEALPLNVPETVIAALDQSQTTAQTVDQAWTPPDLRGYTATGLRDVFPFCIPWDIAWMLGLFEATAEAPHWEINYTLPEFMGGGTLAFNVDLEAWDDVAAVLRTLELIAFCVGLALMTKRLLGGD